MEKDINVRCPLCEGQGRVPHSDLAHALADKETRDKIENYVAELVIAQPKTVGANGSRDFEKEVHSWNPELPIWRRSPKE